MARSKKTEAAPVAEPMAPISVKLPADVVVSARVISGVENIAVADVIAKAAREGISLKTWEKQAIAKRSKVLGD